MGLSKLLSSVRVIQRRVVTGASEHAVRTCSGGPATPCSGPAQSSTATTAAAGDDKEHHGKKGLVLGVYESDGKFELTSFAEEMNTTSGGKICNYLNDISCQLKLGKSFVVTDVVPEYSAVAITSLGRRDAAPHNKLEELDEIKENTRSGIGAGVTALRARGCGLVHVDVGDAPCAAAEAAELAAWRFEEFKHCADRSPPPRVSGVGGDPGEGGWEAGAIRGRAQNWARYLSDMPANKMAPVDFAQAALDMLCPLGIKVTAHDRNWIESQRMEAFLSVARGSCETPIFLECVYTGAASTRPPVLLAAKGVTFDSGGLCLKRPADMEENRGSMAGAAVALAALKALAELKVGLNVSCVVPLCENMISGQCMKVGDVVRALNGLSIQIEDTDMEGRLMLADALVYGQSVHRPSLVVDVATLTRGVLLATGGGAFGCFSNSEGVWEAMRDAGRVSGDRPWRLPLWHYYNHQLTNEASVDLRNKGSGRATPCLGAAFLRNFICGDWVHMDITGVGKLGHAPAPPYLDPRRMTGRPTRTLVNFLENISKCKNVDTTPERQTHNL